MKKDLPYYIGKTRGDTPLTPEERVRMRRTIHTYLAMKPLRIPTRNAERARLLPTFFYSPRAIAAVLVAAVFASGTGISYAAEGALPGDLLYPVKTYVNEPIQGALAVSASAKATWAASVASERLQEATVLAAEGRLSTSTQAQIQRNFIAHTELAVASLAQVASTSPEQSDAAAMRFEAQLSAYQDMLAQVGTGTSTAALQNSIVLARQDAAAVRTLAETRMDDGLREHAIAASFARAAAIQQLASSVRSANEASNALASSSAESIAIQLESASTSISSGNDLLDQHAIPQALGAYQRALDAASRLDAYLQASAAIHARTGLMVGEQEQAGSMPATTTSNASDNSSALGHARRDAHISNSPHNGVTSSAAAPDGSTEQASTAASATSAPSSNSANENTDEVVPAHDHASITSPTLPLSLPLQDDQ